MKYSWYAGMVVSLLIGGFTHHLVTSANADKEKTTVQLVATQNKMKDNRAYTDSLQEDINKIGKVSQDDQLSNKARNLGEQVYKALSDNKLDGGPNDGAAYLKRQNTLSLLFVPNVDAVHDLVYLKVHANDATISVGTLNKGAINVLLKENVDDQAHVITLTYNVAKGLFDSVTTYTQQ